MKISPPFSTRTVHFPRTAKMPPAQPTFQGQSPPRDWTVISAEEAKALLPLKSGFTGFHVLQRLAKLSLQSTKLNSPTIPVGLETMCKTAPFKARREGLELQLYALQDAGLVTVEDWNTIHAQTQALLFPQAPPEALQDTTLRSATLTDRGAAIAQRYQANGFMLAPLYQELKRIAKAYQVPTKAFQDGEEQHELFQSLGLQTLNTLELPFAEYNPPHPDMMAFWEQKRLETMASMMDDDADREVFQEAHQRILTESGPAVVLDVLNRAPLSQAKHWGTRLLMLLGWWSPFPASKIQPQSP